MEPFNPYYVVFWSLTYIFFETTNEELMVEVPLDYIVFYRI